MAAHVHVKDASDLGQPLPRVLVFSESRSSADRIVGLCNGTLAPKVVSVDDQAFAWFVKGLRAFTGRGRRRNLREHLPVLLEDDGDPFACVITQVVLTRNGTYRQGEDVVAVVKELRPELLVVVHAPRSDQWVSSRLRKLADAVFWAAAGRDTGMATDIVRTLYPRLVSGS